MAKIIVLVLTAVILAGSGDFCPAQNLPVVENAQWAPYESGMTSVYGFRAEPGFRKYFNSFVSYQIPSATHTVNPLSRLESPLDQCFLGIRLSQEYSTLSFRAEVWAKIQEESNLKFQDSDWGVGGYPQNQKVIFSEAECRLERGLVLDINADWGIASYRGATFRPVFGFRWQDFRFVSHDGYQFSLMPGMTGPLTGDSILNQYKFKHFYLGARSFVNLYGLGFTLQGDLGRVTADNFDHHFMRGETGGPMNGRGYSWHLNAGLATSFRSFVNLKLEADFLRLVANDCTLENIEENGSVSGSFGGSKIWSDQQSLSAYAELRF